MVRITTQTEEPRITLEVRVLSEIAVRRGGAILQVCPGMWDETFRPQGLRFLPASHLSLAIKSYPALRLGFGSLDADELEEALGRLRRTFIATAHD